MKNILHITRDAFYGQYQVAKKIVENTNKSYKNKMFCYSNLIEKNSKNNQQLNFKAIRIFDEEIITPKILFALKKEADKADIFFYHNQFNYSSLAIAIYMKVFSDNKSISLFHSNIDYNEKEGNVRDYYFRFRELIIINVLTFIVDKLIFITEAQRNSSLKYCFNKKIFKNKSKVINNFIDKKIVQKNKKSVKSKKLNIIFVGRLEQEKGFYDLIMLFDDIDRDINLNIIGDGKQKNLIKKSKNLVYLGKKDFNELIKVYDYSSALILPSYAEIFPVVILEAMARGLVILVSDIPGMREIIQEGRNGYLFPPGDIKKMKDIILYLRDNPKEIERISRNNLKDIHKFTEEKQIPKYLEVYEEVLNSVKKIKPPKLN